MITHIQGRLAEKNPTDVVIDCNGVGYFLNISLHTYSQIPDQENLKLFTHFQVREDSHTLFGFAEKAERIGLVDEVVSPDTLDEATNVMIKQLLANGPVATREAKQLAFDVAYQPINNELMQETSKRISHDVIIYIYT